jgi:hypothetical protein
MKHPAFSVLAVPTLGMSLAGRAAAEENQTPQKACKSSPCLPDGRAAAGAPQTFATHAQLASYGFQWGPSDGNFGAISSGSGTPSSAAPASNAERVAHAVNADRIRKRKA